ncbi:transketolase [Salicibibacter cibi]|uniref:Transketolase n=1 Tax=Salicibibacter cibi TaxID=2743001 RepID=A0A7T7CFI9_9BACI|nr:transketolase [Salicibibacter cibi]QQK80133.1 transketolase [Salicibibacter cibi]
MTSNIEKRAINTIRTLSIDSVNRANAGHPGLPMGAAPMAFALWTRHLKHNPTKPGWWDRDRFVLSAGHGSMLLYSLLHLSGYDLSLGELKNFRQMGSKTPGHPEYGHTAGVDATTGPLGQGIAMSVGMAMAEAHLAATYNREGYELFNHYTYVICSDGDVMEGVASESASLAGHQQLGRLIVLYDSNDISLDGDLNRAFSEDVCKRYEAYGWHTIFIEDGNDVEAIDRAIKEAKEDPRPSFIEVKTVIGFGSPNRAGTNEAHGKPLGDEEATLVKEAYEWDHEPFHIPDDVRAYFEKKQDEAVDGYQQWMKTFEGYSKAFPEKAEELRRAFDRDWQTDQLQTLPSYVAGEDTLATRKASGATIQAISSQVDGLFGGSADLASSNNTLMDAYEDFTKDNREGRNVWFGVREFATASALNGIALHGGLHAYGATFLVFSDYMRPAVRLSALMGVPVTYVFTHDSIAVGEDGPTHEPIEQLPSLRAVPNLSVIRPADGNETVAAWRLSLEAKDHPTALVLTRQGLPTMTDPARTYENVKKGAYILADADRPAAAIVATGSEVALAMGVKEKLSEQGIAVRVISMPSRDLFEKQSEAYRQSVIDTAIPTVTLEAAATFGWERYAGANGKTIGIDQFGASAPGNVVMEAFGFHEETIVNEVKTLLEQ